MDETRQHGGALRGSGCRCVTIRRASWISAQVVDQQLLLALFDQPREMLIAAQCGAEISAELGRSTAPASDTMG